MSRRSRLLKQLDAAYLQGFEHGLTSDITPNLATPHKYLLWAYHAGARDGERRARSLADTPHEHWGGTDRGDCPQCETLYGEQP